MGGFPTSGVPTTRIIVYWGRFRAACCWKPPHRGPVLGGSWDLVTTCNWANKPTYNIPNWPYGGYPKYKSRYKPSYK